MISNTKVALRNIQLRSSNPKPQPATQFRPRITLHFDDYLAAAEGLSNRQAESVVGEACMESPNFLAGG